ncbi:polysaccharide lyase family 1 protein [Leptolyngbya sp. FACHB-261]|uniref:pectate lyase family protein n=1 Tax=Leptolyngbya sp. FACHB-261 TaxID=2692806 RepID=UPI0016886521|nr:pectate lyase [Leptolyngbya sp. FACHB-261]MBD2100691.1 pectate lyase [Leptolyngbya sp. FACHB-261]
MIPALLAPPLTPPALLIASERSPQVLFGRLFNQLQPRVGLASVSLATDRTTDDLVAFPGAEGYGALAKGGRGGKVIAVTNLNDAGPGSLRAATEVREPRIIVFRVGGTITLKRDIVLQDPYVTLAGQTAPGDGITLRGATLLISTHDVIVRGLRVRVGDDPNGPDPGDRDAIAIRAERRNQVYNVIVDHCSVSWAIDENLSTWGPVRNISFQWNLIGEALSQSLHHKGRHSMGLLVGDHAQQISIHHNLFAHNVSRNPSMKGGTATEVVNNVIYNWGNQATDYYSDRDSRSGPLFLNVIGNYYKAGPNSRFRAIGKSASGPLKGSKVYLQGNIGPNRPDDSGDQWLIAGRAKYRSDRPALEPSGIHTDPANTAYERVLASAGAITAGRDSVDQRLLQSVRNGTGGMIDSPREVGGWPNLSSGTAPQDRDQDGMPDSWEQAQGLNPTDPADADNRASSGYTWVEEYLNSLFGSGSRPLEAAALLVCFSGSSLISRAHRHR